MGVSAAECSYDQPAEVSEAVSVGKLNKTGIAAFLVRWLCGI